MKQTIKRVLIGALLGASMLANAQSPPLEQGSIPALCGASESILAHLRAPQSPYKELLMSQGEGHRVVIFVDPDDAELLVFVWFPDGRMCLTGQGEVQRASGRLFRGL